MNNLRYQYGVNGEIITIDISNRTDWIDRTIPPIPKLTPSQSKIIQLCGNFNSTGLIDENNHSVNPDDLPLSQEIKDRLLKWQSEYNTINPSVDPTDTWVENLTHEGLAIAVEIKYALLDWDVYYYLPWPCSNVTMWVTEFIDGRILLDMELVEFFDGINHWDNWDEMDIKRGNKSGI